MKAALPSRVDDEPQDLAELDWDYSARQTCSPSQRRVLLIGGAIVGLALISAPVGTVMFLIAVSSIVYLASLIYRIALFVSSLRADVMITVSEEEARAIPDHDLPTYTVLVPIHNEAGVAAQLLAALDMLDYPKHKLDVRILLEEDDLATYEACLECRPPGHMTLVRVPDSQPKTKPKACNYGVKGSKGELLTIYDAEDLPDKLQLRRAVAAFQRVNGDVACLQARLGYYNPSQNLLTRWFTIEYGMWFALLLPGLMKLDAPLPLGGTSLHIQRSVLDRVGRWDAYNVTEDADLGVRLTRFGYRVMVLDSITYEEANSDFVNWVRQRSRWYKGYMQTWLVHLRHPVRLWRELGPRGFLGFNLFIGGTPLMTALNPLVWFLTLYWFAAEPAWIPRLFPGWVYMISLVCWIFGNVTWIYTGILAAPVTGNAQLVLSAFLMPLYWVMMSMAAVKAMWQLILQPSFWEKTVHGLSHSDAGGHNQ